MSTRKMGVPMPQRHPVRQARLAWALRSLGVACNGQTSGGERPGRLPAPTAWIDAPP